MEKERAVGRLLGCPAGQYHFRASSNSPFSIHIWGLGRLIASLGLEKIPNIARHRNSSWLQSGGKEERGGEKERQPTSKFGTTGRRRGTAADNGTPRTERGPAGARQVWPARSASPLPSLYLSPFPLSGPTLIPRRMVGATLDGRTAGLPASFLPPSAASGPTTLPPLSLSLSEARSERPSPPVSPLPLPVVLSEFPRPSPSLPALAMAMDGRRRRGRRRKAGTLKM